MITVTSNIVQVQAFLARIAYALDGTLDDAVDAALTDLIDQLVAVTPVRSGRMKAGYTIGTAEDGEKALLNMMDYAGFVVDGTRYMHANDALQSVLEQGEIDIEHALNVAVTQLCRG